MQDGADDRDKVRKGPQATAKIRKALEFMRNQHLEVPFIAFYRKEYVEPDLNINDLWRVYKFDEKWTQLQNRKKNMIRLFDKMQKFQAEKLTKDVDQAIPENVRLLRDEDIDRLRGVQSLEELNDVYSHFVLYYGSDVPAMQEAHRQRLRDEAKERRNRLARKKHAEDGDPSIEHEDLDDAVNEDDLKHLDESTVKQAKRNDLYSLCSKVLTLCSLLKSYYYHYNCCAD